MKLPAIHTALTLLLAGLGLSAAAQQPLTTTPTAPRDSVNAIVMNAKAGDAEAQNTIGAWYYTGTYVGKGASPEDAVQWFLRSAKGGNAMATGNLGLCYQLGKGVEQDTVRAMRYYEASLRKGNPELLTQLTQRADSGEVFAAAFLGDIYKAGAGKLMPRNKDLAIHFYEIAAKAGDVNAQTNLGLMYLNQNDGAHALQWFRKASEQGSVPSTYYCGYLLTSGKGVVADQTQGFTYLLRAARENFAAAMWKVAQCYEHGNGVEKSPAEALKWTEKAAQGGIQTARWQLAKYLAGEGSDYRTALSWLGQVSSKRYDKWIVNKYTADNDTAWTPGFKTYLKGMRLMQDSLWADALKQFKALEKSKHTIGTTMQGAVMLTPAYDKANDKKGIKLLEKAAAAHEPLAEYMLGMAYIDGLYGLTPDTNKGLAMLLNAAEQNLGQALCALGNLYYEGRGVEQDYQMAVKYYLKASELNMLTEMAGKRLASCYENGLGGLEANAQEAEKFNTRKYTSAIPAILASLPVEPAK